MDSSIFNTFLVSCTTFGVVFAVFAILYFVMLAMSLVSRFEKPEPAAAPTAVAPAAAAAALPGAVTPQIIAAITAAIVADLGTDNFTITSITPVARVGGSGSAASAWANQGRNQQMKG